MRAIAVLPLILVACTTAPKFGSRQPASSAAEAGAKLGTISPELRAKLLAAVDDMLDWGSDEKVRGHLMSASHLEALENYRTLGVPEDVVVQKGTKRLLNFMEQGRREGLALSEKRFDDFLPKNLREGGLPAIANVESDETSFVAKYDLAPYRELRAKIGRFNPFKMKAGYFATSTDNAFDFAMAINKPYLADQIIFQTLQLDGYERAYKSMEKVGDDAALMTIGFLELVDYYGSDPRTISRPNIIWDIIETFKRVQGPLKANANRVMIDLAMELSEFPGSESKSQYQDNLRYALRLLRSTGELLAKLPIDSVKYNYVTKVKDPAVVEAIRKILPLVKRAEDDEVVEALAAIDANEVISKIALSELKKRNTPRHSNYQFVKALQFYEMANDQDGVRLVIDEMLGEKAGHIEDYQITMYVIPRVLKLDGPKGLDRVTALIDRQISSAREEVEKSRLKYLKEELQNAIAKNDFSEYRPVPSRNSMAPVVKRKNDLLATYDWAKSYIAEHRKVSTPEKQAEMKKQAEEALAAGNSWQSFQRALEAFSFDALVAAGDQLVKGGDGNNAIRPYMAAVVLEQEK